VSAEVIDGKAFAEALRTQVAAAVPDFVSATGRKPGLAVVLVGEDPASQVYVRSKVRATLAAGMESLEHRLPVTATQRDLVALIERLNGDGRVDGILVQLPLPAGIDEKAVIAVIDPAKDVDGFHVANAGRLAVGEKSLIPCTPFGVLALLKHKLGDLSGLEAVVVGRSNIVGKPMAQLLLQQNCTVTIAHSRTRNLPEVVRRGDIVIAAVGRPQMIRGDWLKPGATVIDVGINRIVVDNQGTTRLVGDVDFDTAREVAGAITPVPGGVGPMTIAVLLRNTLIAASARAGLSAPEDL
jgi:methylenetetrahydrofolate dehydrogenase (NADP+)/methenyltetrahydrofolate cyclohydrolase